MKELYYQDNKLRQTKTILNSSFEENGTCFVSFADCIYYPQGGGQKGDRGRILFSDGESFNILKTIKGSEGIGAISITDRIVPSKYINQEVECYLDWDFRYTQMKLHTCLHLHHCILQKLVGGELEYPLTADIENGFAFNKYRQGLFDDVVLESANSEFLLAIKSDSEVHTFPDAEKNGYRWWQCEDYKLPCGGIHVSKLSDIGDVKIIISKKKGHITIKFVL